MKLKAILSIWTILGLALILRIPYLNGSFWLDEAAQALESARPLAQQFDIIPDFQPPLIHLLVHVALYVNQSEWWLRTVAALIPGLITIWVTYKLGEYLSSKWVGLVSALLLATSSFHLFYSQELRPYSLPTLFAVLSWWFLLQRQKKLWSRQSQLWFGVMTVAGLYSSYLYPFLLLSQCCWVLLYDRATLKQMLIVCALASLAFLPWLPIFKLQLAAGGEVRQSLPGWEAVVSIPQLKSLPLVAGKFIYGVLDLGLTPFFVISGLALGLTNGYSIFQLWGDRKKSTQPHFKVLLIWLVVPLISAWIISFWIPVVQPKRVLFLLPAFYLLITSWMGELRQTTAKWLALGLLLAINLYGTAAYYLKPELQRENWAGLHQEIVSEYPTDSVVFFSFPEPFAPWRWYDDGTYPTLSTGTLHIDQVPDLTSQVEAATQYRFVILFDYLRDLSDPERQLEAELEAFGYRAVELKNYPNIGFIRVYGRPGATLSVRSEYETRN